MNREQRRHPSAGFGRRLTVNPQSATVDISYGYDVSRGVVMVKFSKPVNNLDMTPAQAQEIIKSVQQCLDLLANGKAQGPAEGAQQEAANGAS